MSSWIVYRPRKKKVPLDKASEQFDELRVKVLERAVSRNKQNLKRVKAVEEAAQLGARGYEAAVKKFSRGVLPEIEARSNRAKTTVKEMFNDISKKFKRGSLELAADTNLNKLVHKHYITGDPTGVREIDELIRFMRETSTEKP